MGTGLYTKMLFRNGSPIEDRGFRDSDLVFMHYGNTPEIFVDMTAVWCLGGCVVPIGSRLTGFEVETLARAARPRYSLWLGQAEASIAAALPNLGTELLDMSGVEDRASHPDPATLFSPHSVSLDRPALVLAAHQMPQRWYLLDEIPRTSRNKVNRSMVARRCETLKPVDMRGLFRGTAGNAGEPARDS